MNTTQNLQTGKASLSFHRPVFIQSCASVAGKKEGEGPLGSCFDQVWEDPMFGMDTWEAAESTMQKQAAFLALQKAGLTPSDLRMVFAGDLLAQTTASSFGIADMGIPFYGLFGACSTMGESLSLGLRHLQPLCQCGKRIPFPLRLRQSTAFICHLDSYRKRCLHSFF